MHLGKVTGNKAPDIEGNLSFKNFVWIILHPPFKHNKYVEYNLGDLISIGLKYQSEQDSNHV